MDGVVYLNGSFLPADEAKISPFDRGFLFADGVYEVVRCYRGVPFRLADHVSRLNDSLAALSIEGAVDIAWLTEELLRRNELEEAGVYLQITRGAAARVHQFPQPTPKPTIFACATPAEPLVSADDAPAYRAITVPETRWARCEIKSVALLPNVLARQAAHEAGVQEAIFVRADDQVVTEGTARSVFAVIHGVLRTYPLDGSILPSVTRKVILELAAAEGIPASEQPFTREQLMTAAEVFVVGTTTEVRGVVRIDDQPIGDGTVGPTTRRLLAAFNKAVERECDPAKVAQPATRAS